MANFGRYPRIGGGGTVDRDAVKGVIDFSTEAEALARTLTDVVVTPKALDGFTSSASFAISVADGTTKTITAARHGFDNKDVTVRVYETVSASEESEIEVDVSVNPTTFDVTLTWVTPFNGTAVISGN